MRSDQCSLRAFPEWFYADCKQGRVDGFTETTQACQAYAECLEGMQKALSYPLAFH